MSSDVFPQFWISLFFLVFFFLMIRRPPRSTLLSLHDALPILLQRGGEADLALEPLGAHAGRQLGRQHLQDRKSTRLNSSHLVISYAVFCLKKKTNLSLHRDRYNECAIDDNATVTPPIYTSHTV